MPNLNAEEYKSCEGIKHVRENGTEFWYACKLAKVLDYTEWRNFQKVVDRAILACIGKKDRPFYASALRLIPEPNPGRIPVPLPLKEGSKR